MAINNVFAARSEIVSQIQANVLPEIGIGDKYFQKPNSRFDIPSGKLWIRLSMNDLLSEDQEATGGIRFVTGIMTVDVFYPVGKGDKVPHDAAEIIRKKLSNQYYSDTLKIRQGTISDEFEENWYRVKVEFTYTYEGLTNGG